MPNSVSAWISSLAPLAIVVIAAVYAACSALRGRARRRRGQAAPGVYPGSREHAGDVNLAWWRLLPTEVQARYDAEAIRQGAGHDLAVVEERDRVARAALERANEINSLSRF